MARFRVGALPGDALAAAAEFHAKVLPEVRKALGFLAPLPFRGGVGGGVGACGYGETSRLADSPPPNPRSESRASERPEGEGLNHLTLVFPPADHSHRAWRLAAVQSLARAHAPVRVNAAASDDEVAIAAACAYLERSEGVTGQYLPLDGAGAGEVIG